MSLVYVIELPILFPAGIHCGAGSLYNSLLLARDGAGQPVLNGSSLAGVLRSLYMKYLASRLSPNDATEQVERLFGRALNHRKRDSKSVDIASCVRVSNYRLDLGHADVTERTFHLRDRHRGTVAEGGLFSMEATPPGTRCRMVVWIHQQTSDLAAVTEDQILELMHLVHERFKTGLHIGGSSNRGMGMGVIADGEHARSKRFDLTNLESHAEYLEAHLAWRRGEHVPGLSNFVSAATLKTDDSVEFQLSFAIPTGQDILVADGQASDVQLEPQRVLAHDGNYYWRIPGSNFRGLFKQWMLRLATRSGFPVGDRRATYNRDEYTGENVGWAFAPAEQRIKGQASGCPIGSLFGTLGMPGRIKLSDAYIACSHAENEQCNESQLRMHVAVDRVTGGAAEGMLFSNRVLTSEANPFSLSITIRKPQPHEIRWLAQSIVALHIGLLRVGSSKSSGRLAVTGWHGTPNHKLTAEFDSILQKAGIESLADTAQPQELTA